MTNMAQKYTDYSTETRGDFGSSSVEVHDETGKLVKYHYRIFRVPSQKLFILKHCVDSTEADRAEAERVLAQMPRGAWPIWEPWADKCRSADGTYYFWRVFMGTFLDDPLMQLELEMMIDWHRELAV